jgi:formamidopyrimidine-DNA glycosylase
MPELPEVESIKLQLQKFLVGLPRGGALRGHKIIGVEIKYKKCFAGDPRNVIGGKISGVRRFGKALSIDLSNGYSIVIHIKMTGQLIYRGPNLKKSGKLSSKVSGGLGGKHTHVIFTLNKGGVLYYNDMRKFGWIKIVKSDKRKEISFMDKLGPEILIDKNYPPENELLLKDFNTVVQSTGRAIKTLLMDQNKIAGVGNIYANDALWLAKIHPEKKSNELSDNEVAELFKAVKKVLKDGLKYHGASENSFVTPDGMEGKYQQHFLIYGRAGEKCKRCKSGIIKKIKVGGRGTYFCPVCQHK